jgi:CcmD family protein
VKNYEFLFWAYNVIWLGLAGWLLTMILRLRKLSERLDRVEREIDRRGGS